MLDTSFWCGLQCILIRVQCRELSPFGRDEGHEFGDGQFRVLCDEHRSDMCAEELVTGECRVVLLCVLVVDVTQTRLKTDLIRRLVRRL